MQILGLLSIYFDAVVAEVKKNLLLFRLALAILWGKHSFLESRLACHKWLIVRCFLRIF